MVMLGVWSGIFVVPYPESETMTSSPSRRACLPRKVNTVTVHTGLCWQALLLLLMTLQVARQSAQAEADSMKAEVDAVVARQQERVADWEAAVAEEEAALAAKQQELQVFALTAVGSLHLPSFVLLASVQCCCLPGRLWWGHTTGSATRSCMIIRLPCTTSLPKASAASRTAGHTYNLVQCLVTHDLLVPVPLTPLLHTSNAVQARYGSQSCADLVISAVCLAEVKTATGSSLAWHCSCHDFICLSHAGPRPPAQATRDCAHHI